MQFDQQIESTRINQRSPNLVIQKEKAIKKLQKIKQDLEYYQSNGIKTIAYQLALKQYNQQLQFIKQCYQQQRDIQIHFQSQQQMLKYIYQRIDQLPVRVLPPIYQIFVNSQIRVPRDRYRRQRQIFQNQQLVIQENMENSIQWGRQIAQYAVGKMPFFVSAPFSWVFKFIQFLQIQFRGYKIQKIVYFLSQPTNVLTSQLFQQLYQLVMTRVDLAIDKMAMNSVEQQGQISFFRQFISHQLQMFQQQREALSVMQNSPFRRKIFWSWIRSYIRLTLKAVYKGYHQRTIINRNLNIVDSQYQKRLFNFSIAYPYNFFRYFSKKQQENRQNRNMRIAQNWDKLGQAMHVLRLKQIGLRQLQQLQKRVMDQYKKYTSGPQDKGDSKKQTAQQQDTQQLDWQHQFYINATVQAQVMQTTVMQQVRTQLKKIRQQQQRTTTQLKQQQRQILKQGQQMIDQMQQMQQYNRTYQKMRYQYVNRFPNYVPRNQNQVQYQRNLALMWRSFSNHIKSNKTALNLLRRISKLTERQYDYLKKVFHQFLKFKRFAQMNYLNQQNFLKQFWGQDQYKRLKMLDQIIVRAQIVRQQISQRYWNLVMRYAQFWNARKKYVQKVKKLKQQKKDFSQRIKLVKQKRKKTRFSRRQILMRQKQYKQLKQAQRIVNQLPQRQNQLSKQQLQKVIDQFQKVQQLVIQRKQNQQAAQRAKKKIQRDQRQLKQKIARKATLFIKKIRGGRQLQQYKDQRRIMKQLKSGKVTRFKGKKLPKKQPKTKKISRPQLIIQKAKNNNRPITSKTTKAIRRIYKQRGIQIQLHQQMMQRSPMYFQNFQNVVDFAAQLQQNQAIQQQEKQILQNQIEHGVDNIFQAIRQSLVLQQANFYKMRYQQLNKIPQEKPQQFDSQSHQLLPEEIQRIQEIMDIQQQDQNYQQIQQRHLQHQKRKNQRQQQLFKFSQAMQQQLRERQQRQRQRFQRQQNKKIRQQYQQRKKYQQRVAHQKQIQRKKLQDKQKRKKQRIYQQQLQIKQYKQQLQAKKRQIQAKQQQKLILQNLQFIQEQRNLQRIRLQMKAQQQKQRAQIQKQKLEKQKKYAQQSKKKRQQQRRLAYPGKNLQKQRQLFQIQQLKFREQEQKLRKQQQRRQQKRRKWKQINQKKKIQQFQKEKRDLQIQESYKRAEIQKQKQKIIIQQQKSIIQIENLQKQVQKIQSRKSYFKSSSKTPPPKKKKKFPLIQKYFPEVKQVVQQSIKKQQQPNHQLIVAQGLIRHQRNFKAQQMVNQLTPQMRQQIQKFQTNIPLQINQLMLPFQKKQIIQIKKKLQQQDQQIINKNIYQNRFNQIHQRHLQQQQSDVIFFNPLPSYQQDQLQQLQNMIKQVQPVKQYQKQFLQQIIQQLNIPFQQKDQIIQHHREQKQIQQNHQLPRNQDQIAQQFYQLAFQRIQQLDQNIFQVQLNQPLQQQPRQPQLREAQADKNIIEIPSQKADAPINLQQLQDQYGKMVSQQYAQHKNAVKFLTLKDSLFINKVSRQGKFPRIAQDIIQYVDMCKDKHWQSTYQVQQIFFKKDRYQTVGNVIFCEQKFQQSNSITKLNLTQQNIGVIEMSRNPFQAQMVAQQIQLSSISKQLQDVQIKFLQISKDLRTKILRVVYRLFQIIRLHHAVGQYYQLKYRNTFRPLVSFQQDYWITYSIYTTPAYQHQKQINLWGSAIYQITNISQVIKDQVQSQYFRVVQKIYSQILLQLRQNFNTFYQRYQQQINYDVVNVLKTTVTLRSKLLMYKQNQSDQFKLMQQDPFTKNFKLIFNFFNIYQSKIQKIKWKVFGKDLMIFQRYQRPQSHNLFQSIKQPQDCSAKYRYYKPTKETYNYVTNHRQLHKIRNICLGKFICFILQMQIVDIQYLQSRLVQFISQQKTIGIASRLWQDKKVPFYFSFFPQLSKVQGQDNPLTICITINHIYFIEYRKAKKYLQVNYQRQSNKIKFRYIQQKFKYFSQQQIAKINLIRKTSKRKQIYKANQSQKFKTIQYSFRRRSIYVDIQCTANQNGPQDPYLLCYVGYPDQLQSQVQKIYKGKNCIQQFFIDLTQYFVTFNYTKQDPLTIWTFNGNKYQMSYFKPKILQYFGLFRSFGDFNSAKFHSCLQGGIIFRDARTLLASGSLMNLCKQFNSVYKKSQQIQIKLYKNMIQIAADINQIARYCRADCLALMSLLGKFWTSIMQVFDQLQDKVLTQKGQPRKLMPGKLLKIPTAASLALQIFKTAYLKKPIQNNQPQFLNEIQQKYYFGGVTQVIRHIVSQQIYPVDINSSYPKSMTYRLPWFYMGQGLIQQVKQVNQDPSVIQNMFYYQINSFRFPQNSLPTCPIILYQKLFYPIVWFQQQSTIFVWGHTLKQFQAYNVKRIFKYSNINPKTNQNIDYIKKYTQNLYQFKKKQKQKNRKNCIKLLLNSLYGKFGQKQFGQITIYQKQKFQPILREYMESPVFQPNCQLKGGQTYWQFQRQSTSRSHIGQFVRISSYISSYSRTSLHQASKVVNIQNMHYCDTDSLYLTQTGYQRLFNANFVDQQQLGKWKLQQRMKWGIFISPKTSFGRYLNGKFVIKWKGCPPKYIQPVIQKNYKSIIGQFIGLCKQLPIVNKPYPLQSAYLISMRCQAKQGCVWFVRYRRKTNVNFKRYPTQSGRTIPCIIAHGSVFPYLKQNVQFIVKQEQ